jgi:[ribosomal protein S5]-alanine N-acetyltransferase
VQLEDDTILLRPLAETDVPAIVEACSDPEIPRWTSVPEPYTEADARAWVASAHEAAFAIADRETGELLGAIGLEDVGEGRGQVGYWVKRGARGRGVASRALRLLSAWALEAAYERVQLVAEPANRASQRVAEKAGFRAEGLLRSYIVLKGRRRDCVMYALLREEL